ncbi:MAG: hypothetical protein ACRD6X_15165 [Pyrinomonadaceae bacterium]
MTPNANLHERKLELIQWLSVVDDISLLEKVADLKKQEGHDWWSEISEKEKTSVLNGIADADAGALNPHSEAKAIYEKWL